MLDYARSEVRLNRKDATGVSARAHLEAGVKRGLASSLAEWDALPALPDALAHLYAWVLELHGRSGFTPAGVAPLTYATIEAWARLKGMTLQPYEVDALIAIDAVMCAPDATEAA